MIHNSQGMLKLWGMGPLQQLFRRRRWWAMEQARQSLARKQMRPLSITEQRCCACVISSIQCKCEIIRGLEHAGWAHL